MTARQTRRADKADKAAAAQAEAFLRLDADRADMAGQVVLVPGAEVLMLALDLPQGVRGAAREQVAWRQLRDDIGLGPDTVEMHPYRGAGRPDGWTRVLVADAGLMAGWRARVGAARAVLPDYLALPTAPGLWVLALPPGNGADTGSDSGSDSGPDSGSGTMQVRLGPDSGFSCEAGIAPLMLRRALEEAVEDPPRAVLLQGAGSAGWLAALLDEYDIPLLRDTGALKDHGVDPPDVLAHGELAADLRADPRAARDRLHRRILPWRWTVLAALVAVGVWAAVQLFEIDRMERETAALRAEMDTIVRQYFVPSGPILDVRTQVSRALAARQAEAAAASGRESPLVLFGQVADVLAGSDAKTDLAVYTPVDGLALDLRLADFAAVDRLVDAFETAGIAVDLRDARVSGETREVRADLRLRPKSGSETGEVGQ
ncbi:hypothetical protein K3727_21405 (plasmid) [Rhodobacteraceae bacterium M382]|nr:hypothetical protein K3727_21405 [Rhodobacteraceae bacterium M382]